MNHCSLDSQITPLNWAIARLPYRSVTNLEQLIPQLFGISVILTRQFLETGLEIKAIAPPITGFVGAIALLLVK
jgi:hypothetical protein